jgi:hypothetical protein
MLQWRITMIQDTNGEAFTTYKCLEPISLPQIHISNLPSHTFSKEVTYIEHILPLNTNIELKVLCEQTTFT